MPTERRGERAHGQKAEVSRSRGYLKLPEDGGDVCLVGQVGEDLQLKTQNTKGIQGCMRTTRHKA